MQVVRRALSAAFVAVVIAGTASCGSTTGLTASADPLAKLTAGQISERAIADLNKAASVRLAGTGTDSGRALALALTLVRGHGCQGSVSMQGSELRMVYDVKSIWILPNRSFYKSQGLNATVISRLSGKWLRLPKSYMNGLSSFCSLGHLIREMRGHSAKMIKGMVTTVDGQRAVTMRQTGHSGTVYISDAAKPEILELEEATGSATGTFTFSDYGVVTTITPPPASKTVEGSKYGF